MTVAQLISALQTFDSTLDVVMGDFPDDILAVERISVTKNGSVVQMVRLDYGIAAPPLPAGG